MREQVKYVFQIGLMTGVDTKPFEYDIAEQASRLCGGCTTSKKTGWWANDGDEHKRIFTGDIESEICLELELTCEPSKAEFVYEGMKQAIVYMVQVHDLVTNWVHVSEIPMKGRHFSVDAYLNATDTNEAA